MTAPNSPREARYALRCFLQTVVEALDARPGHIQPDEYGTLYIEGKRGHIYGEPHTGAWYLIAMLDSARRWRSTKRILSFGEVTQDGDAEGVIRFTTMPNPEQAKFIRSRIGLKKARHLSPEQQANLVAVGKPFQLRGTEVVS